MEYPIRHISHVTETTSFKRLEQCIPDHWIVRHASERDYGIDLMIEPVTRPGGPITGDLMALQVKGTSSLEWNQSDDDKVRKVTFQGIKKTTVNYWMGLPVPVFLCIHEQKSSEIFFASVKHQVRRRYQKFKSRKTFSFNLSSDLDLSKKHSHVLLMGFYFLEKSYTHFANALTDLLSNRDLYLDYIEGNIDRDSFMEVETAELLRLFKLYQNCKIVVKSSGDEWELPTLYDYIKEDQNLFNDEFVLLHEKTHDKILRALTPLFLTALKKGCAIVEDLESTYWQHRDFLLYRYVTERGSNHWLEEGTNRLKWIISPKNRDSG